MVLVWQTKPLHRFFRSARQRLGTHHHQLHQGRFWCMEARQRDLVPTRWLVYKTQHCYESQCLCGQERSRKLRQLVWWQRICLGAGKLENRRTTAWESTENRRWLFTALEADNIQMSLHTSSCCKENNWICVIVFSQYNWKHYKTNLTL